MKYCELCKGMARTYCESDQASLCWNCDVKVHGANFLVARHSRTVLCHTCQTPTPWKASGSELGVTVSVCESCVVGGRRNSGQGDGEESLGGNDDQIHADYDGDEEAADRDEDEEDENEDEDEDEEVGVDDEDGDNQVVPWSAALSTTPPPAASSSSSEESVSRFGNGCGEASKAFSLKRFREISSDLTSQDHLNRSSPKRKYLLAAISPAGWSGADGGDASAESRPLKAFRTTTESPGQTQPGGFRTESVVESLREFHRRDARNLSG